MATHDDDEGREVHDDNEIRAPWAGVRLGEHDVFVYDAATEHDDLRDWLASMSAAAQRIDSLSPREQLAHAKASGELALEWALKFVRAPEDWSINCQSWLPRCRFVVGLGHGNVGQFLVTIGRDDVEVHLFSPDEYRVVYEDERGVEAAAGAAHAKVLTSHSIDGALKTAVEQACTERSELFISDDELGATVKVASKLLLRGLSAQVRQRLERGAR